MSFKTKLVIHILLGKYEKQNKRNERKKPKLIPNRRIEGKMQYRQLMLRKWLDQNDKAGNRYEFKWEFQGTNKR